MDSVSYDHKILARCLEHSKCPLALAIMIVIIFDAQFCHRAPKKWSMLKKSSLVRTTFKTLHVTAGKFQKCKK